MPVVTCFLRQGGTGRLLSLTVGGEESSALTIVVLRVQGSEERSQALNEAYGMLNEMSARELASYERELRVRGPRGSNLKCAAARVCCLQHADGRAAGRLCTCACACGFLPPSLSNLWLRLCASMRRACVPSWSMCF